MYRSVSIARRRLLGLLAGISVPAVHAAPIHEVSVQTEPSLAHCMDLLHAALKAASFNAALVNAPYASEARNLHEIAAGRTHINLLPVTPARLAMVKEGQLRMIPVPLERGLLGWRTSFVLEGQQDRLATIRSLHDLRSLIVGQGTGWWDIEIYRAAGITTREVQAWRNGEFVEQLKTGAIDLFPMGMEEIMSHFLNYFRRYYANLALDRTLLLRYPWYRFVWVSPHPSADELFEALNKGFDLICNNGAFEAIWGQTRRLPPTHFWQGRTVIELENPFYSPDIVPQRYQHLLLKPYIS